MDGPIFEFGEFVLIPRERLLLRDKEPVPLTAKAFDLLVALVRRTGQLVSKDELLQEVWPGRFVEEVNLSVNISAIRKALGPGGASLIQTVSKGGYRLLAPVVVGASGCRGKIQSDGRTCGARSHKVPGCRSVPARHAPSAPIPTRTAPMSKDVTRGASVQKRG